MGFSAADLMDVVARRPSQGAAQDSRQSRPSMPARERFSLDLKAHERPVPRESSRQTDARAADRASDARSAARSDPEAIRPKTASADRPRATAPDAPARSARGAEAGPRPPTPQAREAEAAAPAPPAAKAPAAAPAEPAIGGDGPAEAQAEAQARALAEAELPEEDVETSETNIAEPDPSAGGLFALLSALQAAPPVPMHAPPGQEPVGSRAPSGDGVEAQAADAAPKAAQSAPEPGPESKAGGAAGAVAQRLPRAGDAAEAVPAGTEALPEGSRVDFAADLAALAPQVPAADPKLLTKDMAAAIGTPSHVAQASEKAAAPALPAPVPLGQVPMTIGLRSLSGSSQFEIRLDPAELGRVDVRLEIDKERGTVTTHLVVERVETLAMLQRDANGLQQALAQAGLDPSEGGINLSLRGEGQSGAGTEQREGQRRGGQAVADAPEIRALDTAPLRSLRGLTGLDIRI
ncbi:flagellar hook-length control protein FliK [Methylobacterium durans]|uniref:Flagellar hook-length control protein FliK n=1 Tax=Methylobacterium durans TaxID=2202825 RepID=A0A2U8WA56_9HYPH|nr:flagellar hook-length control protein FliK [Methylobacterium durans]AWN42202.1 flagellar hook-length control protein FliK [Methylobacterium durans]